MTVSYRILRFTTENCAYCRAQKKALVVERFKDEHPGMQLVELLCASDEDEAKEFPDRFKAYELSDKYEVQSFPTLVIEAKLEGDSSIEVCRITGSTTVKQLEKEFNEAATDLVTEHLKWEK